MALLAGAPVDQGAEQLQSALVAVHLPGIASPPLEASEKLSERKKSRCLLRQSQRAVERFRSTMMSIKAFFVFSCARPQLGPKTLYLSSYS